MKESTTQEQREFKMGDLIKFHAEFADGDDKCLFVVRETLGDRMRIQIVRTTLTLPPSSTVMTSWCYHVPLSEDERARMFNTVYSQEHSDYKNVSADGEKGLLAWAVYGGGLTFLKTMTDGELTERYGFAQEKIQRKRKAGLPVD